MRIDFNQLQTKHIEDPAAQAAGAKSGSSKATAEIPAGGITFGHSEDNLFNRNLTKKKSILEQAEQTDVIGADKAMEQMLVVAQTMSPQDAKKMADEGYDLSKMDPSDAVNSLDRIKIRLAEAGVNVAGYTDTVSAEKVAEVTGRVTDSAGLAADSVSTENAVSEDAYFDADVTDGEIAKTLTDFDLPATKDNIASVKEAVNMASQLRDVTENTKLFLASEGMEPTIENVFMAEFSSGRSQNGENTTFHRNAKYVADAAGYVGKAGNAPLAESEDGRGAVPASESLDRQITEIIKEAGYEPISDVKEDAVSMVNAGVPLTTKTLQTYEDASLISTRPPKKEIMEAIARGGFGKDAYLIADYKNIKAERITKEAALAMASETNLKNLDKDITIDTGYLERDVETLKTREKDVFDLLEETLFARSDIQRAPAELIADSGILEAVSLMGRGAGPAISDGAGQIQESTTQTGTDLRLIHQKAADLTRSYERMNRTYEAVGTEVRADLGDSIRKAFENTDFKEVLGDLGLEQNEANERAVRIISYSHMELSPENVQKISAADGRLNDVLDKLTPARVLRLIRDNVNPLETDLGELESRLEAYVDEEDRPAEEFAKYLVSQTDKGTVTDEEAASYIGIYRLVNAINAGDHRAVGTLVAGGAELNLSNLLSAVRTGKRSHVDMYIDANFGGKDAVFSALSPRIDEMIRTAFSSDVSEQGYYEEESQKFAEAAKAEAELYRMLEEADIPRSADNVTAYEQLLFEGGNRFARELYGNASDRTKDRLRQARDRILEDLGSKDAAKIKESYDEMVKAELIGALEGDTIDIRAMQTKDKVLSIKKALADTEDYHIPAQLNGELININLKLRHGENQNSVDIYFETEDFGSVHAELRVTDGVRGAIKSERTAGDGYMKERLDAMTEAVSGISGKNTYLSIGDMDIPEVSASQSEVPEAMDGGKTGNALLYRIAKTVLDVVLQ